MSLSSYAVGQSLDLGNTGGTGGTGGATAPGGVRLSDLEFINQSNWILTLPSFLYEFVKSNTEAQLLASTGTTEAAWARRGSEAAAVLSARYDEQPLKDRVADVAEFVDTVDVGYAVWSLFVERAVPKLDKAQRAEVVGLLDTRAKAFKAKKEEDIAGLVRANEILLAAADSESLTRLWSNTGPRLLLLLRRPSANGIFDFPQAHAFTVAFRDAVKADDAAAAAAVVREQPARLQGLFDQVREAGIYRA